MSNQVILEEEYDENYEPTEEEVAEYATLIGLDTVKDEHLMYIAREGVNAPLPKDWKPVQDVSGDIYYFNFKTGSSTWDHPCDEYYKNMVIEARQKKEAAPGAGDRASPVVGKKKKKGEGKKKKVKAGGPDSSSLGALAPLKSSGGLSPGGLAPLRSLGGLSSGAQKPSSLLTAPAALKGASMPLMSKSNETFGNVQMLSMSVSEEDSTTNLDGTSSMNFPGASHDYDSSGLELYTASATANKTDTLDNTTDLIKYGLKDIDQLEPVVPVGASTDMDVRESLDSYQSTPRNEPPRLGSRFLKSNQPLKINTQASRTLPTGALSAGPKATPPVIKSIDESTAADTSEIPTTDGDISPVRRSILAGLNPAESLDEQSHLLEGSESEQRGLALTGGLSVEPVVETDDDKRRRAAEAAEVKAALVAKETELKKGEEVELAALREKYDRQLEELKKKLESEVENTKIELLEEKDSEINRLKRELEAERVVEESRLKDTHRDEISSLQREMDTKTSKEKEDLQNKFKAELEDFKLRAAEEHNSQMTNLKQENDSKVADLRESLEDLSSLKKKELDSALEKIREEIRHELEGRDKEERRKLELDYKNKQQNLRNDLEQEMKEMEKQLQSEFSEKKDNLRNQLNSDHVKKMEEMKREIGEVQEAERQQKEEELAKAKESQRLVSGLETDLQQLLDDKKAQLKVQHESELTRYKRDLESKTQLKKSELSTTDMAERTNLEQEHEEAISKARKEFEKLRDSMRLDHKERISRLKLNLDEEEREVEDKSRAMEERKRALDEDQISLEKFSKELAERREKLTKLEKDLKRDETRVGSAEKEKEELVEELSTLRQSLDETRDKLEKSNISRKLLEERLKESETAAKEKAGEVERLRKQGKSRIHKKHVRTVTDSDKENNQGDDSRLSMEDLESDEATIGKRSSRHRSLDDSDIIVNRHSRNHSDSYLSLDDTSMSSDYPQVGGKSMRRIINSENAVQIAKRYLRKHAKSLKDAGDAWSETKRRLRTSSGKYHPLAKRYLTESESDSDVTDLADLDTAELQLRINRRMDNLLSPHKDILPTSPQSSPTLPVSSPLSQLQNLSTYDATVRLQQATQTTSPRTFPQTTQTARPSTQPQHIQTDSPQSALPYAMPYLPSYSGGAPNLSYSNPYIDNPKGDYVWGTMYDHAEKVLERKWRTYFGPSSTLSTSLRHVPFTSSTSPALKGLGSSKHYRSSISSSRPASVDISGKISEQKRWVEEFSKSLPHRAVSGAF